MERETGIEPATSSLGSWHSTAELLPLSADSVFWLTPRHLRISHACLFRRGVYKIYPFRPQNGHQIQPERFVGCVLFGLSSDVHFGVQNRFSHTIARALLFRCFPTLKTVLAVISHKFSDGASSRPMWVRGAVIGTISCGSDRRAGLIALLLVGAPRFSVTSSDGL
jgi:hypothetical protein